MNKFLYTLACAAAAVALLITQPPDCEDTPPLSSPDTLTLPAGEDPGRTLQDILAQTAEAVVFIDNGSGWGTGFIVERDGVLLVWSAYHILAKMDFHGKVIGERDPSELKIRQQISDYHTGELVVLQESDVALVWASPKHDLMLLKILNEDFYAGSVEFSLDREPVPGDEVAAIGNPVDPRLSSSVALGIITGLSRQAPMEEVEGCLFDQSNVGSTQGFSGGPVVFTDDGLVAGIVSWGFGVNINFHIPARVILEAAVAAGFDWAVVPGGVLPDYLK